MERLIKLKLGYIAERKNNLNKLKTSLIHESRRHNIVKMTVLTKDSVKSVQNSNDLFSRHEKDNPQTHEIPKCSEVKISKKKNQI